MSECYGDGHGDDRVRNGDYSVPAWPKGKTAVDLPTGVTALYVCRLANGAVVHVLDHAPGCAANQEMGADCNCLRKSS